MILYIICQLVCVTDPWAHMSLVHSILSLKLGVTQCHHRSFTACSKQPNPSSLATVRSQPSPSPPLSSPRTTLAPRSLPMPSGDRERRSRCRQQGPAMAPPSRYCFGGQLFPSPLSAVRFEIKSPD